MTNLGLELLILTVLLIYIGVFMNKRIYTVNYQQITSSIKLSNLVY